MDCAIGFVKGLRRTRNFKVETGIVAQPIRDIGMAASGGDGTADILSGASGHCSCQASGRSVGAYDAVVRACVLVGDYASLW